MNALRQKLAIGVMGMVGLLASGMASAADFSSWQKSMPVTFSGYTRVESLTNFPALVVLSTNISGFSYAGFLSGTNADLRFTDASQANELNYEVDTWNTNGNSYVWVQVPLLTTNAGIWAYWGSSGQTAPAYTTNGATWSNGYISVHHLNGAGGVLGLKNSVANTNNLTNGGGAADTSAGVVGHSVWLNGGGASTDTNYLTVASNYKGFPAANQPFTLSLWVNMLQTNNSWRGIMGLVPTNTWAPAQVEIRDAGTVRFYVDSYTNVTYQGITGADVPLYADANYSTGVWYYLSMPYDGTKEYFSVNGTMQNGGVGSNVVQNYWTNSLEFDIGRQGSSRSTCLTINALVDEPRVSAVARSANWIWAEWMNMASNSVFTTNGVVQQSSLPRIFNVGSQNLSNTSADVVGTLTTNGASAATVYLYWSTTDGTTNATAWTSGGGSVSNLGVYSAGATFTNTLTGLVPNTTNYWNYSAVNSSGTVWAATAGSPWFKTYGPPGVNNGAGATGVSQVGATLNGNLTNGVAARVYILLGPQDGTWTVTNDLSTLSESSFSKTVSGLPPGTTNYYTCYATNTYGLALATPSVVFTTLQGSAYYWVGASNAPWSAAGSWATSSGGASGAGVPGTGDSVIFDPGGASNALLDAAFAGSVYSVTINPGYSGTITQSNNLTVVRDFSMTTGTWQFVTGVAGTLTVGNNMTVSNATLYCQRISTVGNGTGRVIAVGGNLTVATNGSISAFSLGFSAGGGPGAGGGYAGAGASHGGKGGAYIYNPNNFVVARDTYGSVTAPTSLGSGGDNGNTAGPGDNSPGGGAIQLAVGGTLRVDGTITVNAGQTSFTHNGGGGAGGSVWISANDLAGAGTVSANGRGNGGDAANGGGGRIAVYTSNTFGNVKFQAYDGGNGSLYGAAGTIYLQNGTQTSGQGTLVINNNNHLPTPGSSTMIPIGQTWTFPTVILTNAGMLGVVSNTYSLAGVNLQVDASSHNGVILLDYGTLNVGQTFAYSNYIVNLYHSSYLTATNISVGTNAVLRIDCPNTATGDVTIAAGGVMDHRSWGAGTVEWFKIDLTLQGNLTIQTGGSINLTGKGYSAGFGPGAGGGYQGAAASYGGRGGKCIYTGATNNSRATYGSALSPTNWGSGADGNNTPASTGGGALKLTVSGTLTANGQILANGQDQTHNGGCGSGGSIYIMANDFAGTNLISARGATSTFASQSSGGGGGRIALYSSNSFGNVIVQAQGQSCTYGSGAAGTIYLKGPADGYGRLIVDNAGVATLADVTTLIPTNNFTGAGTNLDVGSVIIQNSGNFEVPTGMVLVVHSYWTNSAIFTADTNSTVVLGDTNAAAVYGNTTFFNLTSTNLGKVLTFQAGRTNTVQGKITLANVTLKSTASGQYTYLTLSTNGGSQQIGAVTVQDNNAGGGQLLLAGPRSVNNGRNVNWKFPAGGTALLFR